MSFATLLQLCFKLCVSFAIAPTFHLLSTRYNLGSQYSAFQHFPDKQGIIYYTSGCFFFPQPGMLSVPFSHSKLLVFCATLTLKQASKKESLGITAPASSSHNLINVVYPETSEHVICNSHHMMVLYKFPNFLIYFLCWIRESPCFIYFPISSFRYQTQYQAYGCFSDCSRENE